MPTEFFARWNADVISSVSSSSSRFRSWKRFPTAAVAGTAFLAGWGSFLGFVDRTGESPSDWEHSSASHSILEPLYLLQRTEGQDMGWNGRGAELAEIR